MSKVPRTARASRRIPAALLLAALPFAARAQVTPAAVPQQPQTQSQPAPARPRAAGTAAPKAGGTNAPDAPKEWLPPPPPLTGRVVGEGGEPIPDVMVSAVPRAPGVNVRAPHVVTADGEGNFQFALKYGLYTLSAGLPGYVNESDPQTGRPGHTYRPGEHAIIRLVKGGVITGSVTDQQGEPLVAINVRAMRVRDLDGRPAQPPFLFFGEDRTDDRGVYRIYGLRPGGYVVYAGGASPSFLASPFGGDAPTFYPSGTRDTAAEVTVRAGQEAAGIDIRYREEQGRRVSGTVEFPAGGPPDFGIGLNLTHVATGTPAGTAGVNMVSADRAFYFEGVADGDYDLQARGGGREGSTVISAPLRVSVRGADVTGLRVKLAPLASLSGTLRIEPAPEADRAREECKGERSARLPQETLVTVPPERAREAAPGRPVSRLTGLPAATPDESGNFSVRSLEPGRYRLSVLPFDEALYVRSVQLPGAAAAAAGSRDPFEVKSGQQLTGLSVHLAEGAASLAGRVEPAEGAAPPPYAQTRVHLVPRERERAEDPLRFYETAVAPDGTFSLKNLAPGRYLVLARVEALAAEGPPRPAAWDADARARLRREAESANTSVELTPCRRTADFVLRFPQSR